MFANNTKFNHSNSRRQAMGADTRVSNAITNLNGEPLIYAQTGGMISPARHELPEGTLLYRFANGSIPVPRAVVGGWWVEKREFEKLSHFAQAQNIHVAMAARVLCAVPPEWSDMGLLMRARVRKPLLAYRGLGNNVVVPKSDGLGDVRMKVNNNNTARRLHQLYIPGLQEQASRTQDHVLPGAILVEETWKLDKSATNRGWLYV